MGCSAAVLGVQRRQPPPPLGKRGTSIQEHMGSGLGLGEGRGEAGEQKGLSRVLRATGQQAPIQGLGDPQAVINKQQKYPRNWASPRTC